MMCSVKIETDETPITAALDTDAFLDETVEVMPQLLAVPHVPVPTILMQLVRLLVPVILTDEVSAAALAGAREALTTFLASAAVGNGTALCGALGVGEVPS